MWQRGKITGMFNKTVSYLDSSFSDHGFLRLFWNSFEELPGRMYRCNQPFPYQIARLKEKYNIKSVLNLRGKRTCSSYFLEKAYCDKNKIKLYDYPLSSRDMPSKNKILNFFDLIDKIEYPSVMHCKSGADRVGLASSLYLIKKKNLTVSEAKKQLSIKHLHLKYAKTGILDYFFETAIKKGKDSPQDFILWVKNSYSPEKLKSEFTTNSLISFFIDKILRRE